MNRLERMKDDATALRFAADALLWGLWTAIPCIIEKVDFKKMTVEAQPTIRGLNIDKCGARQSEDLPLLVDVPIHYPQGGGFTLTFPIKKGDECLVVFSSRCIDAWWQCGGVQGQLEHRRHDLSDGFAFVGFRSQPRVLDPSPDCENTQLRSDDGEAHVTIKPDHTVTLINPDASATLSPGGKVAIKAKQEIELNAPSIKLCGALTTTGCNGEETTSFINGELQTSQDMISDCKGKSVSQTNHVHKCANCGTTQEPV